MAQDINIQSGDDLQEWLEAHAGDQLAPWAHLLAQRSALRVFPVVLTIGTVDHLLPHEKQSLVLRSLRSNILSLLVDKWPSGDINSAAYLASLAVSEAAEFAGKAASPQATRVSNAACFAAEAASHVAALAAARTADATALAALAVARAVNAADYAAITRAADAAGAAASALTADCQMLMQSGAGALKNAPLWMTFDDSDDGNPVTVRPPNEIIKWMDRLPLLTDILGPNAALIDAWYQPLFAGQPPRFNDERARDFFIENTGKDFWEITDDRSGEDVMNDIAAGLGWSAENASSTAEPDEQPLEASSAIAQLVNLASPIPRAEVANGVVKIDIATNPLVDEPIGSDELADLPMVQRELCNSIRQSLPENTPKSVDASLGGYERHLATRGTRPSTRLLRQLGVAIIVDFEGSEADLWNEGTYALYVGFKENHLLLLEHYPLSEQVEELLDQIMLDEEAAVGSALEQPVLDVVEAAERLSEIDLTTDDFDEFIEMVKTDVKNYASMPPVPGSANPPSVKHSGRKRFLAGTIGFFERLYAFIGSTASIASTDAGRAVLAALVRAIAALKAFFGL